MADRNAGKRASTPKQGKPAADAPSADVVAQADGASTTDDAGLAERAGQVDTGMGAFGDGHFRGGASGGRGYGQDTELPGGLGQGSGYAQSSGAGGYGQGAPAQADGDESGAAQRSDERYSRFDGPGEQRGSQYGYGGRGSEQADVPATPVGDPSRNAPTAKPQGMKSPARGTRKRGKS